MYRCEEDEREIFPPSRRKPTAKKTTTTTTPDRGKKRRGLSLHARVEEKLLLVANRLFLSPCTSPRRSQPQPFQSWNLFVSPGPSLQLPSSFFFAGHTEVGVRLEGEEKGTERRRGNERGENSYPFSFHWVLVFLLTVDGVVIVVTAVLTWRTCLSISIDVDILLPLVCMGFLRRDEQRKLTPDGCFFGRRKRNRDSDFDAHLFFPFCCYLCVAEKGAVFE